MPSFRLTLSERRALERQRIMAQVLAPLWVPLCLLVMRFVFWWRIEGLPEARAAFAKASHVPGTPVLICANHLTMLDSALIARSLAPAWKQVLHNASVPWNTPAQENFASTWWKQALSWVFKCLPVERGGDRRSIGALLDRVVYLTGHGESALIFPEGGRSRSGRVNVEAVTYGVGRIVKAFPGCQVVCVYLRGRNQETWTSRPAVGEIFDVRVESFEPKTDHAGLRGSVDISGQILHRLAAMEQRHFDGR